MAQSFGIATFRFLFFLSILLLLLQTQSTDAANTVIWKNHCDYDLYFWVVPPGGPERNDAFTRVPARGEHIHQMIWHKDGGIVLKYRDVPYYTRAPAGILQAEYYMDRRENKLWYDSSIIDCDRGLGPQNPYYCPFAHGGVNITCTMATAASSGATTSASTCSMDISQYSRDYGTDFVYQQGDSILCRCSYTPNTTAKAADVPSPTRIP
ncbi:uncharacterized protein CC84DRAFT_1214645 [Paraphaeosphaeria sporulosa]|uniref:Uncharacterized protein n=1 Tax=Paraphaeosphaeria sporulosa TaxID=1460663 RepID=A0A177CLJ3_9PLEO|nr:uncharacterized protein CC84DRAFT_1214645 [Paraphaeosphaeria sporulosa]OAG08111.1 hypothetical protein CC84DRAFT_1214645 [Paraphaeosphaeria sporulosa]